MKEIQCVYTYLPIHICIQISSDRTFYIKLSNFAICKTYFIKYIHHYFECPTHLELNLICHQTYSNLSLKQSINHLQKILRLLLTDVTCNSDVSCVIYVVYFRASTVISQRQIYVHLQYASCHISPDAFRDLATQISYRKVNI